jgi:hypothetical protein
MSYIYQNMDRALHECKGDILADEIATGGRNRLARKIYNKMVREYKNNRPYSSAYLRGGEEEKEIPPLPQLTELFYSDDAIRFLSSSTSALPKRNLKQIYDDDETQFLTSSSTTRDLADGVKKIYTNIVTNMLDDYLEVYQQDSEPDDKEKIKGDIDTLAYLVWICTHQDFKAILKENNTYDNLFIGGPTKRARKYFSKLEVGGNDVEETDRNRRILKADYMNDAAYRPVRTFCANHETWSRQLLPNKDPMWVSDHAPCYQVVKIGNKSIKTITWNILSKPLADDSFCYYDTEIKEFDKNTDEEWFDNRVSAIVGIVKEWVTNRVSGGDYIITLVEVDKTTGYQLKQAISHGDHREHGKKYGTFVICGH